MCMAGFRCFPGLQKALPIVMTRVDDEASSSRVRIGLSHSTPPCAHKHVKYIISGSACCQQ